MEDIVVYLTMKIIDINRIDKLSIIIRNTLRSSLIFYALFVNHDLVFKSFMVIAFVKYSIQLLWQKAHLYFSNIGYFIDYFFKIYQSSLSWIFSLHKMFLIHLLRYETCTHTLKYL